MSVTTPAPTSAALDTRLTPARLNLMRVGYLFMGGGLALVKWRQLPGAADLPLYESVTLCILTAMSLLALLGLRHPVAMLPLLVFESVWKVLWLAVVALPRATGEGLDTATTEVAVNCSLVLVILAVTPWTYVWHRYVRTPGDPWRPASDA